MMPWRASWRASWMILVLGLVAYRSGTGAATTRDDGATRLGRQRQGGAGDADIESSEGVGTSSLLSDNGNAGRGAEDGDELDNLESDELENFDALSLNDDDYDDDDDEEDDEDDNGGRKTIILGGWGDEESRLVTDPMSESAAADATAAAAADIDEEDCDAANESLDDFDLDLELDSELSADIEAIEKRLKRLSKLLVKDDDWDDYFLNLTTNFTFLNTSVYRDFNFTLPLNYSSFLNHSPYLNSSLLFMLSNVSHVVLHGNGSHRFNFSSLANGTKKAEKRPMWRCYNGSGIKYGIVQVVNLTQLGLFLHRLPCCNRKTCPTVAEQEANKRHHLLANACSASPRLQLLRVALAGSICISGDADMNAPVPVKRPVRIPIKLNLLWPVDMSQHEMMSEVHGSQPGGNSSIFYGIGDYYSGESSGSRKKSSSGAGGSGSSAGKNGSNSTVTEESCQCTVLMIYSPLCPYSVKLSPVFGALARRFPALPFLAVNADKDVSVHYIYGVVGLPTVILLHKRHERYYARLFSDWQDLDKMSKFVTKYTDLQPLPNITVNVSDYETGLPVVVEQRTDYFLYFSVVYVVIGAWFLLVR